MQFGPYRALNPLQLYPMQSYVSAWAAERAGSSYLLVAVTGVAAHAQHSINACLLRDVEAASRVAVPAVAPIEFDIARDDLGRNIAYAAWNQPLPSAITLEGLLRASTGEGSSLAMLTASETSNLTERLRESLRQSTSRRALLPPSAAAHLGAGLAIAVHEARGANPDSAPEFTTGSIVLGRDGAVRLLPSLPALRAAEEASWMGNEFRFGVGLLGRGSGEAGLVSQLAATVIEWLAPSTTNPYRDPTNRAALEALLLAAIDPAPPGCSLDEFTRVMIAFDTASNGTEALGDFVSRHWAQAPSDARWGR